MASCLDILVGHDVSCRDLYRWDYREDSKAWTRHKMSWRVVASLGLLFVCLFWSRHMWSWWGCNRLWAFSQRRCVDGPRALFLNNSQSRHSMSWQGGRDTDACLTHAGRASHVWHMSSDFRGGLGEWCVELSNSSLQKEGLLSFSLTWWKGKMRALWRVTD